MGLVQTTECGYTLVAPRLRKIWDKVKFEWREVSKLQQNSFESQLF